MPRQHFPAVQGAGRARPTTPEPVEQPAVLISPIKARAAKKSIVSKTDVEVWSLPDQEIVGQYQCPLQAGLVYITSFIQRLQSPLGARRSMITMTSPFAEKWTIMGNP